MIAALNVADRIRKEEISKQEIYSDFADIFDKCNELPRCFEIDDFCRKNSQMKHRCRFGSDGYRNLQITRKFGGKTERARSAPSARDQKSSTAGSFRESPLARMMARKWCMSLYNNKLHQIISANSE